jgi:glucose-6-phosphate isomerase
MKQVLELINIPENKTIVLQRSRGEGQRTDFTSPSFKEANRLVMDLTYMFDSSEPTHLSRQDVEALIPRVLQAHRMLLNDEGDIREGTLPMTGWQNLPEQISPEHLTELKTLARELTAKIDAFVSLGIGGSYLGLEATFKALTHQYFNQLSREDRGGAPEIYFLGQNMDPDYFRDTLDMLMHKRVGLNVISKSGTTLETAVAFRITEQLLEQNFGQKAKEMILVTTDRTKGALKNLAIQKGYRTLVIPENIGGRFSILTDVGLFGLAMAEIDIEEFVAGFRNMRCLTLIEEFWQNPALVHAAVRYAAWQKGKKIEVVATNSTALYGLARWMEQLFPESEGQAGHGLWVSPGLYSEKLHANGQMVQEGERNLIETFLYLKEHDNLLTIPLSKDDFDGLNYLAEKKMDLNQINHQVIEGPAYAHFQGGVPNMTIEIPKRNAYNLGQLYYLMEKSVALSGYLFGHNPFVQPGVEAYKTALFALLGRPGSQEKAARMQADLQKLQRTRIHA